MRNEFQIDPEAKCKIQLSRQLDHNEDPYFIGKLQVPMTMDFDEGVSFMIFTSEEGYEELQIGPLDPMRRAKSRKDGTGFVAGRLSIDLHPMKDKNDKTYYIGEIVGPVVMKLRDGIFFTIFTSVDGEEELQIGKLRHKKRFNREFREPSDESFTKRPYERMWKKPAFEEDGIS